MSCSIHSMSHCESTLGPNCARLMPMPICSDVRFQGSHLSECLTINHAEQWEDTFLFRISTATVVDDYDASARGRLPIHRLRLMWLSCHFFFRLKSEIELLQNGWLNRSGIQMDRCQWDKAGKSQFVTSRRQYNAMPTFKSDVRCSQSRADR